MRFARKKRRVKERVVNYERILPHSPIFIHEFLKWGSSSLRLVVEIPKSKHAQVILGVGFHTHLIIKGADPISCGLKVTLATIKGSTKVHY